MKNPTLPLLFALLCAAPVVASSSAAFSSVSASSPKGQVGKVARAVGAAARAKHAADHARSGRSTPAAKSSEVGVGTYVVVGLVGLLVLGWLSDNAKSLVE